MAVGRGCAGAGPDAAFQFGLAPEGAKDAFASFVPLLMTGSVAVVA